MAKKKPAKAKKERQPKLTAKQKKLIALLPLVELGTLTKMEAMKQAGYADSTAREQSQIMGGLGNNAAMQSALREIGVDENKLAGEIKKGLSGFGHVKRAYVELGVKLLDGFPTQRHQVVTPTGYAEIETPPRAKDPKEARSKAKEEDFDE